MSGTVADLLLARAGDRHPGLRTRERTWTWDEVVRESAARAAILTARRDAGRPFHVGVLLDNVPDFLFWLGGAALAGAAVVGINPTRRGTDLEQEVRSVDCLMIVTDAAGAALLDGLDVGVADADVLRVDDPAYPQLVAAHACDPARADGVDEATLMLLLLTSGTTGTSKAARCSQGRLARLAFANCAKYDIDRDDVCYCCMPLFHGNALMGLWAPALSQGATICLTRKFSASGFLPDARYFGATYFTYVGKAVSYVLATPQRPDDRDNDLDHGFGTEASPDDQAAFLRRFGARLVEAYGSSESAGHVAAAPDAPPGALGRPAHDGVAVLDPQTLRRCAPARLDGHGRLLNPDEAIGEIADREAAARFEGYYNNEAANRERVRDGWYWSGDLGYLDEAGFLYFAGRRGDWVRVDGENFSALDVERILRRYDGVLAAAAFAVPDPVSGDRLMVALEVDDPEAFDLAAFAAFLVRQPDLGTKATPRFVRVSAALPATGSNKLAKKQIQDDAWRSADPVFAWRGRGPVTYLPMGEADKDVLEREFFASGRQRLLPVGAVRQ
ncbi:MAG: acyl-CoA synthetase [Jatrophihabitans sp.]|nr:MAG: acyl-CoA synthetase [Jatrophihabitans sp.]